MDEFESKVKRAYWLRVQARSLEDEANEILASLGDLRPDKYPAGEFILQVTPTRRFDAATARRNLTEKQFKSILQKQPSATLAKEVLGDEFAKTQKTYGVTRKIIPVTDEEGDY